MACLIPFGCAVTQMCGLQGLLAVLFAAGTVVTTLNTYGLSLLDPSKLDLSPASVAAALPGTLAFFALLGQCCHTQHAP